MPMSGRYTRTHELTAGLLERIGDPTCAAIASERAAAERIAYAHAAAQHPEWSVDVSFGLIDDHHAGAAAGSSRLGPGRR